MEEGEELEEVEKPVRQKKSLLQKQAAVLNKGLLFVIHIVSQFRCSRFGRMFAVESEKKTTTKTKKKNAKRRN